MNIALVVVGILVICVVLYKVSSGMRRHRHVLNILYANHTFQQLTDEDKSAVSAVATHILHKGNGSSNRVLERLNDLQRFSLYALAMEELKIPPAGDKYAWSHIPNPLAVPGHTEADIELFEKDHGVKLNLTP